MEIPPERIDRVAVNYKTCLALAREMARGGSGREARIQYGEATTIERLATTLVGPDEWAAALNRTAAAGGAGPSV